MKSNNYIPMSIRIVKRSVDIVASIIGLLLTLPVWPVIAIAIKLDSAGPVFFKQLRIGRSLPDRVELFMMVKFRTMSSDAEDRSGAVWASEGDNRITKVGLFLRKTRLDELPQLWNVLIGEMSVVGPRPERPALCKDLMSQIPYYLERTFYVAPGITGLAQVNQGYDQTIDDVKNKLFYDHAYAFSMSSFSQWWRMEVTVAFKTVWVMVTGRGM